MSHPLHSFAIISFASSPFIPTSSGHLVLSLIASTIRGLFFLGERVPGTHNYNHKSKQEKKKSTLHQKKILFLGYIKCSRDPNLRLGSSSTLCTLVIKPVPFLPNTKDIDPRVRQSSCFVNKDGASSPFSDTHLDCLVTIRKTLQQLKSGRRGSALGMGICSTLHTINSFLKRADHLLLFRVRSF